MITNPGAGGSRLFKGFFISAAQESEESVMDLGNNLERRQEIVVSRIELSLIEKWKYFYVEAYYSPQKGKKKGFIGFGSSDFYESSNGIKLDTFQLSLGVSLFDILSFGFKKNFTNANYSENISEDYSETQFTSENTLDAEYDVSGIGASINLFDTGFAVGYALETVELKSQVQINESQNSTEFSDSSNYSYGSLKEVKKKSYGVSFSIGDPKKTSIKFEYSKEIIPSLKANTSQRVLGTGVDTNTEFVLDDGKLDRFSLEANWASFHGGVQVNKVKGHFIDSLNLIPYFLNFETFSNQSKIDYGLFGGFRTQKGHSISILYFLSNTKNKEKLSVSRETRYPVKKDVKLMSLSYGFVF